MNATDSKGVTPLHLALSRLRMLGGKEERGGGEGGEGEREGVGERGSGGEGVSSFRKKEIIHVSSGYILFCEGTQGFRVGGFAPTTKFSICVMLCILLLNR